MSSNTIYDMFGFTLPGTNYCGPYNRMGRKTRSALDRACRKHDIAYEEYLQSGEWPIWYNNSADARLLEAAQNDPSLAGYITRAWFRGKRVLAPRMNEPPRKRQHRDPDDLPSNVLSWRESAMDLKNNYPALESNVPALLEREYGMSVNRTNNEFVPGFKSYGPHVGVPHTYQPGPRFDFREVMQIKTTSALQQTISTPLSIGRTEWNSWVGQIPIRYWDEVAAVPALREGTVGTSFSTGTDLTRRGNMKFHFAIQIVGRLKNNSFTEAEIQMKEVVWISPTGDDWLNQVNASFAGAIESTTALTPVWYNNPLYNPLNWHSDNKTWRYGPSKTVFLQPGQSTTFYIDYSIIVDPNDLLYMDPAAGGSFFTKVPKQKELHIKLKGDLGHDGTNVALVPVDAVDLEWETKVKIHISSNTYKDKLLTTGSDAVYTSTAVKNINQQGDMVLEP